MQEGCHQGSWEGMQTVPHVCLRPVCSLILWMGLCWAPGTTSRPQAAALSKSDQPSAFLRPGMARRAWGMEDKQVNAQEAG